MADERTNTAVWILGGIGLAVVVVILLFRGGADAPRDDPAEANALEVEQTLREGGLMINHFPSARRIDEGSRALGLTSNAIAGTDISALQIQTYASGDARAQATDRVDDWCPECIALIECGPILVAFAPQAGAREGPAGVQEEAARSERILENRWGGCERRELGPR